MFAEDQDQPCAGEAGLCPATPPSSQPPGSGAPPATCPPRLLCVLALSEPLASSLQLQLLRDTEESSVGSGCKHFRPLTWEWVRCEWLLPSGLLTTVSHTSGLKEPQWIILFPKVKWNSSSLPVGATPSEVTFWGSGQAAGVTGRWPQVHPLLTQGPKFSSCQNLGTGLSFAFHFLNNFIYISLFSAMLGFHSAQAFL